MTPNVSVHKQRGYVEVACGSYFHYLKDVKLGKQALEEHTETVKQTDFINNLRIKLWLSIKLLKGESFENAINLCIDKAYMHDPDYIDLVK